MKYNFKKLKALIKNQAPKYKNRTIKTLSFINVDKTKDTIKVEDLFKS